VAQAETAGRERSWLWQKGQSGNPAGRPKGSKNKATLLAEDVLGEEEVRRLVRRLYERALAGSDAALRFLLSRILPPARHARVAFDLPEPTGRAGFDAAAALEALARAVADGVIAPAEARVVASFLERGRKLMEAEREAPKAAAPQPAVPRPSPLPTAASVIPSVLSPPVPRGRDGLLAGASALPAAFMAAACQPTGRARPRAAA
jgi:Family of unknown function (DUF5681)